MQTIKQTISTVLVFSAALLFISIPVDAQEAEVSIDSTRFKTLMSEIQAGGRQDSLFCAIGNLHLDIQEWNRAGEFFNRAIDDNPANPAAHTGLGLTYFYKGESTFIPIEKIKQLLKIDNFSKAKKQFLLALEYDPDCEDALYYLASTCLLQEGMANYHLSVTYFKELLAKNKYYKDADYMLGVAYRHTGNLSAAETIYRNLMRDERSPGKARIGLSEICMETSRTEEAIILYYRGLERLTDRDMIDEIYAEIEILLEDEEKREYRDQDYSTRPLLIKKFWKEKDPTPTTPENERYNVHFERLNIARNRYPTLIPPYFDDRGKIFVKYGEPDNKYISERYAEMIKPNESWSYEHSLGEGMVFDFVREGHSFWEVKTLADALHPGTGTSPVELYAERSYLSPTYQRLGISGDESKMIDYMAKKSLAHKRAPAEMSFHTLDGNPLQFFYNFARFREEDGKTRTEVYCGVPRNNLSFIDHNMGKKTTVEYTLIFQDSNFTDIKRVKKNFPLYAAENENAAAGMFLYQENVTLPPGEYRMGIRIENPESDSRNVFKHSIELQPVATTLTLSDIELASDISMSSQQGAFVKNGLKVIPLPYNIISNRRPVYTYFEIYNLSLGMNGKSDYTVSYKVSMIREKKSGVGRALSSIGNLFSGKDKSGISSSYSTSSETRDVHEFLSFDLSRLKPGIIEMQITVRDNILEEETSQLLTLRLVE